MMMMIMKYGLFISLRYDGVFFCSLFFVLVVVVVVFVVVVCFLFVVVVFFKSFVSSDFQKTVTRTRSIGEYTIH